MKHDFETKFKMASWEKLGNCAHDYMSIGQSIHFRRELENTITWCCQKCGNKSMMYDDAKPMIIDRHYPTTWNPCGDLNHIRELEVKMKDAERIMYCRILKKRQPCDPDVDDYEVWWVRYATAKQCAEAMVEVGFIQIVEK